MNAEDREKLLSLSREALVREGQLHLQQIEGFNLTNLIKAGDLFPEHFYKVVALCRREN